MSPALWPFAGHFMPVVYLLAERTHGLAGSHASSGLVRSIVHGFAASVGWMAARALGLGPAALVLAGVAGWWLLRSRRRRRVHAD